MNAVSGQRAGGEAANTPQWTSFTLGPLVLGPHHVPVDTEPAEAAQDVPLATLSAITHGRQPEAAALLKRWPPP